MKPKLLILGNFHVFLVAVVSTIDVAAVLGVLRSFGDLPTDFTPLYGVYQIGEVLARSTVTIGISSFMVIPKRLAS